MAKIAEYLKQILSARYGRDVRQSIHDAISAINDESTECWATVEKVPETLAIAAVKDRVSGKDITLPMSSDFVATDFKAGGNTEQDTTSGKNLLDCSGLTEQTIYGVTFTPKYSETEEDVKKGYPLGSLMYINANGMATERANYDLNTAFSLSAGRYWLNGVTGGSNSTYVIFIANYTVSSNGDQVFTLTEDKTNLHAFIAVYAGTTLNNVKFYPMIRLATITDDTYKPFTAGASPNPKYPQPLRKVILSEIKTCGKNLAKINETNWTVGKNYITNKGANSGAYLIETLNLKANTTYYINLLLLSKPTTSTSFSAFINGVAMGNDVSFGNFQAYDLNKVYTRIYTPTQDEKISYQMWGNTNSETFNFQFWISTDEADKTYEPYTESVVTLSEPITLNGWNGVQDYADVKRGVEHHKFKKIRLTSDLGWAYVSSSGGWVYTNKITDFARVGKLADGREYGNAICNVGLFSATFGADEKGFSMWYASSYNDCRLAFRNEYTTDATTWKNYIDSNEVYLLYKLAEPIETPLPEADVEALKNIRTFKGTTHIFTDSEVKPDLEVEYVIDTKLYIDAKFAEMQ